MPTTIDDNLLKRLLREAADGRKERREALKQTEAKGIEQIKGGQVKEGVLTLGGANAPVFQSLLTGAGLMWLAMSPYASKMEIFVKIWWLRGLLVILGGLYLWRKQSSFAAAVLAAGAAIFVRDWESRPEAKKEAAGPGDEAAGYWWEGRWYEPRWERERERQIARRRWEELPEGVRAAERMADRVFEGARREF
jgi:hypothetical protein